MDDSRCRVGDHAGLSHGAREGLWSSRWHRGWGIPACATAGLTLTLFLWLAEAIPARAQAPAPVGREPDAAGADTDEPLSRRYRFSERYAVAEDPGHPELITQYRVGTTETVRSETEKAAGAPDREEHTYHSIYTERPAKVGRLGEVSDVVRRYDRFQAMLDGAPDPLLSPLFRDLFVWYRHRPASLPEVMSLVPNRSLRQEEYDLTTLQPFFPRLMTLMPARPVRRADTWPISRAAAEVLLGDLREAQSIALEGRLADVHRAGAGTTMAAIIEIDGDVDLITGPGAVRARITFLFEPQAAANQGRADDNAAGRRAAQETGLVEARGYIAKLQMGRSQTIPLDPDGRFRQTNTRELVMARRLDPARPGSGVTDTLKVPDPPPTADESNSWLLYDDPKGQFHFRHPQTFRIRGVSKEQIVMVYFHQTGMDTLLLFPIAKQTDPQRERARFDPQAFLKQFKDDYQQKRYEMINVLANWLPEARWASLNRKVYRVETAAKQGADAPEGRAGGRVYLDAYLVLMPRNEVFHVLAMTDRENHVIVRDQAEGLIRSLELGPSTPPLRDGPASASQPGSPTRPATVSPPAVSDHSTAPATAPAGPTPRGRPPAGAPEAPAVPRP